MRIVPWDDLVSVAAVNEDRGAHVADLGEIVIAVAHEPPQGNDARQPAHAHGGDIGDAGERGFEQQGGEWAFGRDLHCHARGERIAMQDEVARVPRGECDGSAAVGVEPRFAGTPRCAT